MKRLSLLFAGLLVGALGGSFVVGTMLHGQQAAAPAVVKELTSYRDIVKKIQPAVVSIETRAKVAHIKGPKAPRAFNDFQVPEEFRKFLEEFNQVPFEPGMPPRQGFGSGFFIAPEGVILTNQHVVAGADHVIVTLMDGRKFTSKDIHGDRRTDLAIIRIDGKGSKFPYLELGDSDAMEIGDRVLAFGAPFGLTGSVTNGIVSAKGRNGLHMNMYEDFLQTDAAINPGNSGGPLVNLEGKVIGINAAIKSHSGGFQGVGLAIASNLAKNVSKALRTDGAVHRGYLGVQVRELDPEVAQRLGVPADTGLVVGRVFPGSPAAKAKLQGGDILITLDGKKVKDGRALQNIVAALPLHKSVNLQVIRDGKTQTLSVTIEEQPGDFGTTTAPAPFTRPGNSRATPVEKLGIDLAELTPQMADDLGYPEDTTGVVISRVVPGGVAFEAGLRSGMLVSKVDGRSVATPQAARQAMEKASLSRGILLQVQTPEGGTNFVLLRQSAEK
jgi:serine protease Do